MTHKIENSFKLEQMDAAQKRSYAIGGVPETVWRDALEAGFGRSREIIKQWKVQERARIRAERDEKRRADIEQRRIDREIARAAKATEKKNKKKQPTIEGGGVNDTAANRFGIRWQSSNIVSFSADNTAKLSCRFILQANQNSGARTQYCAPRLAARAS